MPTMMYVHPAIRELFRVAKSSAHLVQRTGPASAPALSAPRPAGTVRAAPRRACPRRLLTGARQVQGRPAAAGLASRGCGRHEAAESGRVVLVIGGDDG
jgi:hypothetical protein